MQSLLNVTALLQKVHFSGFNQMLPPGSATGRAFAFTQTPDKQYAYMTLLEIHTTGSATRPACCECCLLILECTDLSLFFTDCLQYDHSEVKRLSTPKNLPNAPCIGISCPTTDRLAGDPTWSLCVPASPRLLTM